MQRLDSLALQHETLHKNEVLIKQHASFDHIIAVRSGSFKALSDKKTTPTCIQQFYLPGELIGFQGIHNKLYPFTVIALETSSVCKINFEKLISIANKIPTLQRHLFALMSQNLTHDYVINPNSDADERVATFLLGLSIRFKRRGLSANAFRLSMSRQDIGNHLGLATETVSRILSSFAQQKLIQIQRREVSLLAPTALHEIAKLNHFCTY